MQAERELLLMLQSVYIPKAQENSTAYVTLDGVYAEGSQEQFPTDLRLHIPFPASLR